jgi:hypothetical protein
VIQVAAGNIFYKETATFYKFIIFSWMAFFKQQRKKLCRESSRTKKDVEMIAKKKNNFQNLASFDK